MKKFMLVIAMMLSFSVSHAKDVYILVSKEEANEMFLRLLDEGFEIKEIRLLDYEMNGNILITSEI